MRRFQGLQNSNSLYSLHTPIPFLSTFLKIPTITTNGKQSFVYVFVPLAKGQLFYLSFFENSMEEQQRYCSKINNRTAIATIQC